MDTENKNPIQVADRLFGALEYLAAHGASTLMEIAHALELNKSTMHRVLTSLQYRDYVRQNAEDGKYELTFKVVKLSNQFLQQIDVLSIVRPYLKQLMEFSGETVHFVKRDGTDVIYIDKVQSTLNSVQMVSQIGSRIPIYRSAVGKAITACLDKSEIADLWKQSDIKKITPYTITSLSDFNRTLADVRKNGYALDNEENEIGVRCVAVSLQKQNMSTEYAISISAPVGRMNDERIKELADAELKVKKEIEKLI